MISTWSRCGRREIGMCQTGQNDVKSALGITYVSATPHRTSLRVEHYGEKLSEWNKWIEENLEGTDITLPSSLSVHKHEWYCLRFLRIKTHLKHYTLSYDIIISFTTIFGALALKFSVGKCKWGNQIHSTAYNIANIARDSPETEVASWRSKITEQ